MVELETQRICMECGQRIIGRTDKKFCNDHCRTAWHNKIHGNETSYVKNVNSILRKNRKILAELRANGTKRVESAVLLKRGFEFDYFTSIKQCRNGVLRCCYEQTYLQLPGEVRLYSS